jgi:hypothetical protein
MAKVAAKADKDYRNNLKRVQSTKFKMSEDEKEVNPFIHSGFLRAFLRKTIL